MAMLIEAVLASAVGAAVVDARSAENPPRALLRRGTVAAGARDDGLRDAVVDAVRADAGLLAGMDAGRVQLLSVEELVWSDGSLGCPQPGVMVTQALVPGWRIRVQAGERTLDYHASRRGQWLLCPTALPPPAPGPGPVSR
jgi:hypothetical protein